MRTFCYAYNPDKSECFEAVEEDGKFYFRVGYPSELEASTKFAREVMARNAELEKSGEPFRFIIKFPPESSMKAKSVQDGEGYEIELGGNTFIVHKVGSQVHLENITDPNAARVVSVWDVPWLERNGGEVMLSMFEDIAKCGAR